MKNLPLLLLCLFLITALGCKKEDLVFQLEPCKNDAVVVDRQTNKQGRIQLIADFWVIDIEIDGKLVRCQPCNLPDELKIENKQIVFDADFHPILPQVKMAGQPIEITKIYTD